MMKFMKDFDRLQNSLYFNSVSDNSSCPHTTAKLCFDNFKKCTFCIKNPTLLPTCILALIIGLYCSKRICQLPGKFPTRWFYGITFYLYGIMMTSAGILHCFIGDEQKLSTIIENLDGTSMEFFQLLVTIMDVGLTTNIAVSFLFCGLCDIGFFNPQSIYTRYLLFISYVTVFVLWTLGILYKWSWIFYGLYVGVISVCCFLYLLTQLCIKSNRRALPALFAGGLYGAVGLLAGSFGADHICKSEGPYWSLYFGPEFIWFLFSDLSVAFIFLYVLQVNQGKKTTIKNYQINAHKNPEKF